MQTPASIARHPIHPMLVPIPIGLWIFSFVCDLFHAFGAGSDAWTTVAFYTMAGGIIGALLAALPGLIDLLSLPEGPRSTAIKHMALNLTIVVLYIINFVARWHAPQNPGGLVWLSLVAASSRRFGLAWWQNGLRIRRSRCWRERTHEAVVLLR